MWPSLVDAAMPETFLTTQREDYLKWTPRVSSAATGIERGLRSRYTNPLYALLGIATLVLAIAAANLCALVFARTESRQQELAVRLALGAGRRRVVGGLGVEGALLGMAGAIGGIAFAAFASDAIIRFLVRDYTVRTSLNASPDMTVIAVAMLSSVGVAVAATIAAAVATTASRRLDAWGIAHRRAIVANRTNPGRRANRRIHRDAGACLAARSQRLHHHGRRLGSDERHRHRRLSVTAPQRLSEAGCRHLLPAGARSRDGGARRGVSRVRHVQARRRRACRPSTSAAAARHEPRRISRPSGRPSRPGSSRPSAFRSCAAATSRSPTRETSTKVAVISAHLERQLFGEGQGLGQRIRVSARPEWQDAEVVGIVSDARVFDVRSNNRAIVYTPPCRAARRRITSAWSRARPRRPRRSCNGPSSRSVWS